MADRAPVTALPTHNVANQPTEYAPCDLWATDGPLREAVRREGAAWAEPALASLGTAAGSEAVMALGELANRHPPQPRTFDARGHRLDEVDFHPAYHELMALAFGRRLHAIAWAHPRPGGHVAHAALGYLLTQAEAGVLCPVAMTYAAVPVLRAQPDLRVALSQEFLGRADGWPGLAARYGLPQRPSAIDHGLSYAALATARIDVTDIYTTDARIAELKLHTLQDDAHYFPRYDAVLLYRADLPQRAPLAWQRIAGLQGRIDTARIHFLATEVIAGWPQLCAAYRATHAVASEDPARPPLPAVRPALCSYAKDAIR